MAGRPKQYVNDGDIGCGKPGDPQWHMCVLAQIPTEGIPAYMKTVFDVEIVGPDIREQAMEIINGERT